MCSQAGALVRIHAIGPCSRAANNAWNMSPSALIEPSTDCHLTPLPTAEEVSSLSAILLARQFGGGLGGHIRFAAVERRADRVREILAIELDGRAE
jgi:hypothetical protein